MLFLRLFGGLRVEGDGASLSGRAGQRRRLALLAILGAAPLRQISRDKLIALLWPDSDAERARHQLASCLYDLRQGLGETVILAAGDVLQLDAEHVRSDVWEYEEALAAGDRARAVALYTAPLLDGFSLSGASEFEHWVEEERGRLAGQYARALEALAQEEEAAGNLGAAVEWWRRLAAHDPYCSRVALRLMEALTAAGDPGGALRHRRVHETLLREELGTGLTPEVAALAERIQAGQLGKTMPVARPEGEKTPAPMVSGAALRAGSPPWEPASAQPHARPPAARHRRSFRAWRGRWLMGVAAGMVITVLGLRLLGSSEPEEASASGSPAPDRIAVLPFAVRGGAELEYLGEGMVSLLSVALDGTGELNSLDARTVLGAARKAGMRELDAPAARRLAEQLGAGVFVIGDVVESNRRVRISAALFALGEPRTPRVQGSVEGGVAEIFTLVDALAGQLLAGGNRGPGKRAVQTAARTTSSIPALKAYLEGEHEMWQGRWERAVLAFQRATAEDSTFALAWYRLSLAAEWFSRGDIQRDAAEHAVQHMDRLTDHDRNLLGALLAWRRGDAAEAEQRYRAIVGSNPEDVEAWFQLGEVWFHYGPLLGQPVSRSREAWERVLSAEPDHGPALFHLARIAALEGSVEELDSLTRRITRLQPDSERTLEMQAFRALLLGDAAERQRVATSLDRASDNTLIITVRSVLTYLGAPREADALVELLIQPRRSTEVQALGHLLLAHTAVARGRWQQAQIHLDGVDALMPAWGLEHRALLSLAPHLAVPASELARLRKALVGWNAAAVPPTNTPGLYVRAHDGVHPQIRLYLLGMLSARLGEHAAAAGYAAELEQVAAANPELARSFVHRVRAESYRQRGMPHQALSELEAARSDQLYDYTNNSPFYSQAYDRLRRAELLRQLGGSREPLGWYGSLREISPYEFVHLGPALLAQAEIHEQLHEREQAVELYRRLVELWHDADAPLRRYVELALQRIERLGAAT